MRNRHLQSNQMNLVDRKCRLSGDYGIPTSQPHLLLCSMVDEDNERTLKLLPNI